MIDNLDAIEEIEFEASADLYRAVPEDLRAAYEIAIRSIGTATCLSCRGVGPSTVFRRVTGLGIGWAVTQAELDGVLEYMNGLGVEYAVALAPHAQPPALASWLEQRGFASGYAWMKFSGPCRSAVEASTALDIRVVGPEYAQEFGRTVAEGFGLPAAIGPWLAGLPGRPNWVCVMGFADGRGVATGAAYVRGDYAWLGFGATLPSHRKLGAQGAVLARRLVEAASRGAKVAVTETGERVPDKPSSSYRNILRAGFKEMYLRQNYMSPS